MSITSTHDRPESSLKRDGYRAYFTLFAILSLFLAASPTLRFMGASVPYDRICEGLILLLVGARLLMRRFELPRFWSSSAALIMLYIMLSGLLNSIYSAGYHATLFLIDGKILLSVVALWIFGTTAITEKKDRVRLATLVYVAFTVGVITFGVLNFGSGERLKLLDESNYMMVALLITSVCYLEAREAKVLSTTWIVVFALLTIAAMLAQSRTGFAVVAVVAGCMLWSNKKFWPIVVGIWAIAMVVVLDFEAFAESLTRGQTDIAEIDRFVFLNELIYHWSQMNWWEVLFGNHVGTYLSDRTVGMQYWVARQSSEQNIPFGLAPFNFHAMIFRLPADIGLLPAVVVMFALFRILRMTVSPYIVAVLFISCLSMSVFYLSSLMPFLILAQLLRPRSFLRPGLKSQTRAGPLLREKRA